MLSVFSVAPVDGAVIAAALDLGLPDFDDAVTAAAAEAVGCAAIVTRDARGFSGAQLPVLDPRAASAAVQRGA